MYEYILSHLRRLIQKVNLFIAVAISMVDYIAIMVFQIAKSFSCGSNIRNFLRSEDDYVKVSRLVKLFNTLG